MIINRSCCIKLVPLVIFIYDARSHIHEIVNELGLTDHHKEIVEEESGLICCKTVAESCYGSTSIA